MLTLWYIILGWKEYNKPFRKVEQPPKTTDPDKKPDLILQKKDVIPTPPKDIKKPEPPKSIPLDPRPPAPQPDESSTFNSKTPEVKPSLPTPKEPEVPKSREIPKVPEPLKVVPKTPEPPNVPPKKPDVPKTPPKTPETPKAPFRLAPEVPKNQDPPKTPEPSKPSPKTPEGSKSEPSRFPEGPPNALPSRRPESVMPDFPPSNKNPAYVPPPHQSEFPIPPYLPGAPQSKPLSRDDELFSMGSANPTPNRPIGNLRDLSYAKGEFPGEVIPPKVQDNLSKTPKYMEQRVISNPDSLESDEDDEDF